MLRRLFVVFALSAFFAGSVAAQDADPFMRHPSVHPDGNQIAFSYQGDLWTVPVDGGSPERLTIHEAYEGEPRWSPDGNRVAFTSDRYGNSDLYVMDAAGSTPERLTYHSTGDDIGGWTPDGRILFTTGRTYAQAEWSDEIYTVNGTGGTPDRLLDAVGSSPRMSPDGRFIAFERGYNDVTKKGYEGPADRNLWVYDTENDTYTQLTTFTGNDHSPVWTGPRTLLYITEQTGAYNVHRLNVTDEGAADGSPEAVTSYDEEGIRALSASADGSVIAFERETDVYILEDGGEPEPLDVTVPADYRFSPTEKVQMNSAGDYAVSPNGEQIALELRGELFLMQNETDEPRTRRLTNHSYRDRDVAWMNDSTLVFSSDRNGNQYDLYRLTSADPEHPGDLFDALQHNVERMTNTEEDERVLEMAPDFSRVAFRRGAMTGYGEGELVTATVSNGTLEGETVLAEGWNAPTDVAWSPDSEWLAYSRENLNFNSDVFIHAADGSTEPVNVSQHPRGDSNPVWSPDGSKLGFVSDRSGGDTDIWYVWLQEEDWERTERDWEEIEDEESENGENGNGEDETPDVEIDFENIHDRLEQLTNMPAGEGDPVIAEDGETFFFVGGRSPGPAGAESDVDLYSIEWDGSDQTRITEQDVGPYGLRLSPDHSQIFFTHSGGQLARVATDDPDMERLSFNASMTVNHEEERSQIFAEVGRTLGQGFYDPNYHGDDWNALLEEYRPWAMEASTMQDFQDVLNLMLGELNASHMGFYGGDRAETQDDDTGLLGVEIDPVETGVEVQRVVPRSPADREASTLEEGDVITAVDGQSVAEADNFYQLLEGTAGEKILLSVTGPDGNDRTVRIRPTGSLSNELYREWVEDRKELVEEYSDGRLGYIHVEGMDWGSFEHFERELFASGHDKEGLIIDVRYNGGGWTTDYLMTVLNVQRHAYTVPRGATDNLEENHTDFRAHYPFGERLPYAAWTKPVATLANENSYSNAEIFSHAFKNLDHGPLVGQPTFGAVISTGGAGLLGGSFVRMPYRGWYVYQTDENMEHGPARPDIQVENPPGIKAEGEDPQLRRAVEALLNN